MSHYYLADENGEFEVEFCDYKTGEIIARCHRKGLKPYFRIGADFIKGGSR